MATSCTRCEGTGFLNIYQYTEITGVDFYDLNDPINDVLAWLKECKKPNDVQVCDCCGDGTGWYGDPGEHYSGADLPGPDGPYAYNGGLCECH